MASKFTIHNGIESDNVNAAINFTVPVTFGGVSLGVSLTGVARFVNADNGVDAGDGKQASDPFATIQHAVDASAAGDVIVVAPGTYDENLVVETDYLTIVGAVGGYGRPDVTPATGVALTVSAQGFRCARVRFAASDDDAVVQEGNGFTYVDCVFDGDAGQAATDALVRLKGNASDDSMTASEGVIQNCLFRGSDGFGLVFDTGDAPGNGVGCTHDVIDSCRFIDNVAADVATRDTGTGVYSVQDTQITRCSFMEPKNKATWVDFTTSNGGAASDQTGVIEDCFFNDDTVDTTAVAIVGTGWGVVGCHSMDGEFDGSGLD
jgi:uncharacterized protein DUF1565